MFTKALFALAIVLATASGGLAATKTQNAIAPSYNVYNPRGAYVGADPDPSVRFEVRRDWARGY